MKTGFLLRITGLYTLRRLFGGSGFRSPRSVGLQPRSHGSLHPHFGNPANAKAGKNGFMPLRLLIRVAKTSYTAGTLCDIWT